MPQGQGMVTTSHQTSEAGGGCVWGGGWGGGGLAHGQVCLVSPLSFPLTVGLVHLLFFSGPALPFWAYFLNCEVG